MIGNYVAISLSMLLQTFIKHNIPGEREVGCRDKRAITVAGSIVQIMK